MDSSESTLGSEKYRAVEYRGEFYGESPRYIGVGSWSPAVSEEEYIEEGPLNVIESVAITSLLQDAIDELTILKYVIGAPEVIWNLNYKTLAERYTRRLTPERIFPEVDSRPVLTSAIKLQRDRDSIEVVFQKIVQSLSDGGNYSPLTYALGSLRYEEEDDINLIQELRNNLLYMKELTIKVEEKRKLDEQEEKERDELMYQLQYLAENKSNTREREQGGNGCDITDFRCTTIDELDDIILKCDVEEKFVNKWENVRNAQNNWRLQMSENYLKDNIAKLATKSRLERRVTHELQTYLKIRQAELEEELEEWMSRYDSEMERRENKILHLKYDRDQAEERKHQLHKLYETRSLEMKEWVQFRELRKIRIGASLVIQSWWRGMMVRKKLGPYKPKKQKAEKAAKKKK